MNKIFTLFWIIFLSPLNLTAWTVCRNHSDEYRSIRQDAVQSIYDAHKHGGKLFRDSFAFTPQEAAFDSLNGMVGYSQFSACFKRFINYCHPDGINYLLNGYDRMEDKFYNLYTICIAKHQNPHAMYERGRIFFERGIYDCCLDDIKSVINSKEWQKQFSESNTNEILETAGKAQFEAGLYEEAIHTLSNLIEKDPKNKEAYFTRAQTYFEIGAFDIAIKDYMASERSKKLSNIKAKTSKEFDSSLLKGLKEGGKEAIIEMIPSLLNTAHGIGQTLWAFVNHPVDSSVNFSNACYNLSTEIINSLNHEQFSKYKDEFKDLIRKFDNLSDEDKGHLIGYYIGKYGVDFFMGMGGIKILKEINALKEANRVCILETMKSSPSGKEAIISAATKHASERKSFFQNVKIHVDKQNKHVPGKHNYMPGKSIFLHPDPQTLLNKYAGKGTPLANRIPGRHDYREKIDFGEFIGYHVDRFTGEKILTNWGEIRYSNTGAHIVPCLKSEI